MQSTSRYTFACLLIVALCTAACGSSKPSSAFNGTYRGRLTGISCVDDQSVTISVEHRVTSEGDEAGDNVELYDALDNSYRGVVSLVINDTSQVYGFSLGAVNVEEEALPRVIAYNFFARPEGEPTVSMLFRVSDSNSPGGSCEFEVTGDLSKDRPE
jgi:hypothetical protein